MFYLEIIKTFTLISTPTSNGENKQTHQMKKKTHTHTHTKMRITKAPIQFHLDCVSNLTKLSHTTIIFFAIYNVNSPTQNPFPETLHKTHICIHIYNLINLACNSRRFSSWLNVNLVSRAFCTFSNQQHSSSSFFLYSSSCWLSPFSLKKENRKIYAFLQWTQHVSPTLLLMQQTRIFPWLEIFKGLILAFEGFYPDH